jgi:hypothetical protein
VLEAAREALVKHGPAIDQQGGGLHAVQAGMILMHDFALTEDEAWPLFVEWNETCVPPFDVEDDSKSDDSLRERLRRGQKYGSAEYGCRRTMDALQRALKIVADWDRDQGTMRAMVASVRDVRFTDTVDRTQVELALTAATGLKPRQLDLPDIITPPIVAGPGEVLVNHVLHTVADDSIKAIAPHVFVRNGVLCEVVSAERTFISDLETARVQDLMSRSAKFIKNDEGATLAIAPPLAIAQILHSRRTHANVRVLEAITTAPIFLADGSLLQDEGYNAQARVYLKPSVKVDVLDEPTRTDARNAVRLFQDLLCDFKFHTKADFSSWLAALLSPLVKAATANAPSPLFCVSAASAGAGKSRLTETIAQIVTGQAAEVRPYNPRDPAEWGKRLTAFVKAASPVNVFDNVNGAIGDEGLDRLITSTTWSDRQLGVSEAPPLPNVSTWMATGNNIEPILDTVRRVLMVRIEVDTERPQERTGFKWDLEGGIVLERRSELLSAALTILRAFHVAGRPTDGLASWGSFSTWSALVRGAIVWTGLADPFLTQRRAATDLNEPENEAHDFWLSVVGDCDGLAASIVTGANQRDPASVLGLREPLTTYGLKRFIGRFVDKPRAGRRIRKTTDPVRNQVRYVVEAVEGV